MGLVRQGRAMGDSECAGLWWDVGRGQVSGAALWGAAVAVLMLSSSSVEAFALTFLGLRVSCQVSHLAYGMQVYKALCKKRDSCAKKPRCRSLRGLKNGCC